MLFNSFEFLLFFPAVVALFYAVPHRWRWVLLLSASYIFYMFWRVEYALLIIISTIVDYTAALEIEKKESRARKNTWLILSLTVNLGLLFAFKYFNFIHANLQFIFSTALHEPTSPALDVLLPIGISFYTFQTISYTIDVYRGKITAEKHLGKFALFVTFFPQLVAGPIERAGHLLPQFEKVNHFEYHRVTSGLKQMLWGFFKKIVIADRLRVIVDATYGSPEDQSGLALLLATYCFAFQIYCDFSGYTDIAIGAAKVMGYNLGENFRLPYIAKSIREFWRRWHISLSNWFRDYVYFSLGGNRVSIMHWTLNLAVVFLLSGIWHGANWTFVAWGALHGLFYIADRVITKVLPSVTRIPSFFKVIFTFHLVLLAWIFFRAASISDAFAITNKLMTLSFQQSELLGLIKTIGAGALFITLAATLIFALTDPFIDGIIKGKRQLKTKFANYILFGSMFAMIILFGYFGEVEFIYFQF